ncbi:MAG TPA: hypothetical protein PLL10_08900, partial [Elusimicrobiales bacterium]|nr:hypothetical protein [Elusimicrobiales bacterium]
PRKIDSSENWLAVADKKQEPAPASEPPGSSAVLDYNPALVPGGPTLYEDSAKPAAPGDIVGIVPKKSREAARLPAPLFEKGAPKTASLPEAGLSNPPVAVPQLEGAGVLPERNNRAEDFAAYAPTVDMPNMGMDPKYLRGSRRVAAAPSRPNDKQDLTSALSDETQASQSLASGYLSAQPENTAGGEERKAFKAGGLFDGSASVDGHIKSVFDISAAGEQPVVSPAGVQAQEDPACVLARESEGKQMLLAGDQMSRLAESLGAGRKSGCCDYVLLDKRNNVMSQLALRCVAYNNAAVRQAVACRGQYFPIDCGVFAPEERQAKPLRCMGILAIGLLLLLAGAALPVLGPAYVILGGALSGGAILGNLPGLVLCVAGVVLAGRYIGSSGKIAA